MSDSLYELKMTTDWRWVPVEPTEEMITEVLGVDRDIGHLRGRARAEYKAWINAAPPDGPFTLLETLKLTERANATLCAELQRIRRELKSRDKPAVATNDIRKKALALYNGPFVYQHGYIFDAVHHMVADDHDSPFRVRGWGRIQYGKDAAKVQDEVGTIMAEALTAYWQSAATTPAVAQQGPLTDGQIDALVISACHSDPHTVNGDYYLTKGEIRALLAKHRSQP